MNWRCTREITSSSWLCLAFLGVVGLCLCSSALGQERALVSTEPPVAEEENDIAACKTDLRLSGSVFDAEHPERSLAVFEVPSSHASAVYRLGSRVAMYELVAVVPRGVILRSSDGDCWLRLVADAGAHRARVAEPPKPTPAPAPEPKKKKKRSRSDNKQKPTGGAVVVGGSAS